MKATEGPWNVSSGTIVFSDLANLKIICNTAPCLYSGLGEKRIELDEAQANAALIASSPCLFEALKDVLDALGALNKWWELVGHGIEEKRAKEILSVLAKADGHDL